MGNKATTYTIYNKKNESLTGTFSELAKVIGVKRLYIYRLFAHSERYKSTKGWYAEPYQQKTTTTKGRSLKTFTIYRDVVDELGVATIEKASGTADELAEVTGSNPNNIRCLFNGKSKELRGTKWRSTKEKVHIKKKDAIHSLIKNNETVTGNTEELALQIDCNPSNIRNLLSGRYRTIKGWSVK